jgi:glycosyltransferase involved in cell wall biosynthesis
MRFTFLTDSEEQLETMPTGIDLRVVRSGTATALAASADGHRSMADLWRMSRALSDPGFDLLLFPTIYSYVPVRSRARKVVFVHDVIAETYPKLTHPRLLPRLFWRTKVALGIRQAGALITVSEFSRRGIVGRFAVKPEQVHVVGEACDPVFRVVDRPALGAGLRSLGIDESRRIVLYVGGFGPHKNLESLAGAFARVARTQGNEELLLVMVGERRKQIFHSSADGLERRIGELDIAGRVIFTGFLPDADLVELMNVASVLVLPSFMEGFGLPAIEAAACGCPVIATRESPLPEILGPGGIYIDPTRPAELESALAAVLQSQELRVRMRRAGIEAAHKLNWDSAAASLSQILREVANQ